MSSRFALVAGVLLASLAAIPLSAQQPAPQSAGSAMRDTSGAKAPAVGHATATDSALVDLGRAITALAVSVQTVVAETAKNPELRRSAVQTAGKAVSLAQRTLEDNTSEIEKLLAEASRRLSAVEASQKTKATAPAPTKP
jgi:hypothetical protein